MKKWELDQRMAHTHLTAPDGYALAEPMQYYGMYQKL